MKTKILLASILGCSSILTGYAKENINNNSHMVAGTNYAGQFKAIAGTDKITGERIVTYALPSGLLSEPEKYASYEITFGNSHNGMKSEKSEEIPINENTLTYVYRVSDKVAEGTVWEGYILTYDKQHETHDVFSLNPVTIPAIDEKVLISEPQEDGTVFTITYDDPSVTLNPSLSNTKKGDVVLDDGMEVINDSSTSPNQLKVKINEKAIHTIKVNVSDKQVKQYKLQVGPQQYPQNIIGNNLFDINMMTLPTSPGYIGYMNIAGNCHSDGIVTNDLISLNGSRIDPYKITLSSGRGLDRAVHKAFPVRYWINPKKDYYIIDIYLYDDHNKLFLYDFSMELEFNPSSKYYKQLASEELVVHYNGKVIETESEIHWSNPVAVK
ncbi:hypothetical protein [Francisella hispaniensis]|uniref:Cadherin-like beta sandwich domain-containing protein n=1 Tax=Francisella hispaniensis FSC454 TaxID=1088883 RepID=A0AAC9JAT7_9GAMM|nr:hypothetical protein [Francisella hispaniensis]APD51113.1 hypothetical protein FSC454_08515 [Francisella hispaniensis FSC454]KYW86720.1 hypothetical protein AUF42_00550 [Francisella hispaniensis FSC454]